MNYFVSMEKILFHLCSHSKTPVCACVSDGGGRKVEVDFISAKKLFLNAYANSYCHWGNQQKGKRTNTHTTKIGL